MSNIEIDQVEYKAPSSALRRFAQLAGVGGLIVVAGIVIAPDRIWPNLLLFAYYMLGLSLGGLLFIAIMNATRSGWSTVIRRVPEAMASLLPIALLFIGAVLIIRFSISGWFAVYNTDIETFWFKNLWLNKGFMVVRGLIYVAVWVFFARAIIGRSRKQDIDGQMVHTKKNIRLSAGFLIAFAFTFTLASFDWIMSLEPLWFSTMFGVYNFAGMFLSSLAAMSIIVIWLIRLGPFRDVVKEKHLHDLGSLVFGFACFWGYIWFSQYLLIWYANIPEETVYFVGRTSGTWGPFFFLNFILNFAVPFIGLMSKGAKINKDWLVMVCVVVLIGRWVDLYQMILPSSMGTMSGFGIWEIGVIIGGIGVFGFVLLHALGKAKIIPSKDPYLAESLTHS